MNATCQCQQMKDQSSTVHPVPITDFQRTEFQAFSLPTYTAHCLLPPVLKEERKHNTQDNEQTATNDAIQTVQTDQSTTHCSV